MDTVVYSEIIEYPSADFKAHLEGKDTDRIVFSGRYGTGKTTFLNQFFSTEDMISKYDVFHLFPVNYSIASNEDIIRYIKHDIIYQFLEKGRQINENSRSYLETIPEFFKKNLDKVAAAIVYMIPKIGHDVVGAYEKWRKLIDDLMKYHDDAKESKCDKLVEYLKGFENADGGIYENDIVTEIIVGSLKDNGGRESILIVDDLDRLDPEHVFRIMNVFAAHFDNPKFAKDPERVHFRNKFGFDKIILVCDFRNIENIFYFKYGKEADFAGYSDKFYSSDIFHFNNTDGIYRIINKSLQKAVRSIADEPAITSYFIPLLLRDEFLSTIIQFFLKHSLVTLRNVRKIESAKVNPEVEIKFSEILTVKAHKIPICLQLKMLRDMVGEANRLVEVLNKCRNLGEPFNDYEFLFGQCLYLTKVVDPDFLIHIKNHFFYKGESVVLSPRTSNGQLQSVEVLQVKKLSEHEFVPGDRISVSAKDFWDEFKNACVTLMQIGYLR